MKKTSLTLLILGLLFSVFYIRAGWSPTETYLEYRPDLSGRLIRIAGWESDELYVTTAFLGYIFFMLFALLNRQKARDTGRSPLMNRFILVNMFGLLFELTSWVQMYYQSFRGKHFRVGVLLMLFGLWLWDRMYHRPAAAPHEQGD